MEMANRIAAAAFRRHLYGPPKRLGVRQPPQTASSRIRPCPPSSTLCQYHSSPPVRQDDVTQANAASPKVEDLFQRIIFLDLVEVHLLAELINEKLGITVSDAERARMAKGGGGGAGKTEEDEEAAAPAEVKTAFDVKLTAFDAKSKIKVIKEVRAITGLGLKEAKELVEGVPSTVKKDIKQEEADELKAKLEGLGATIEIV